MNHSIVLSTVSSLRIADTRAAFGALPAARRRWENCRMTGFQRVASKALRTDVRPPQMVRSLRNRPLSRLKGTTPTTLDKTIVGNALYVQTVIEVARAVEGGVVLWRVERR